MAGRTVLQMDQIAPENQIIFWHIRERREESNMDRNLHLYAGGDHQKAARSQNRTLQYFTDIKPDTFRENTIGSTAYEF